MMHWIHPLQICALTSSRLVGRRALLVLVDRPILRAPDNGDCLQGKKYKKEAATNVTDNNNNKSRQNQVQRVTINNKQQHEPLVTHGVATRSGARAAGRRRHCVHTPRTKEGRKLNFLAAEPTIHKAE